MLIWLKTPGHSLSRWQGERVFTHACSELTLSHSVKGLHLSPEINIFVVVPHIQGGLPTSVH